MRVISEVAPIIEHNSSRPTSRQLRDAKVAAIAAARSLAQLAFGMRQEGGEFNRTGEPAAFIERVNGLIMESEMIHARWKQHVADTPALDLLDSRTPLSHQPVRVGTRINQSTAKTAHGVVGLALDRFLCYATAITASDLRAIDIATRCIAANAGLREDDLVAWITLEHADALHSIPHESSPALTPPVDEQRRWGVCVADVGCSAETFRKYAMKVGVRVPSGPGKSNHEITLREHLRICRHMSLHAGTQKDRCAALSIIHDHENIAVEKPPESRKTIETRKR